MTSYVSALTAWRCTSRLLRRHPPQRMSLTCRHCCAVQSCRCQESERMHRDNTPAAVCISINSKFRSLWITANRLLTADSSVFTHIEQKLHGQLNMYASKFRRGCMFTCLILSELWQIFAAGIHKVFFIYCASRLYVFLRFWCTINDESAFSQFLQYCDTCKCNKIADRSSWLLWVEYH